MILIFSSHNILVDAIEDCITLNDWLECSYRYDTIVLSKEYLIEHVINLVKIILKESLDPLKTEKGLNNFFILNL